MCADSGDFECGASKREVKLSSGGGAPGMAAATADASIVVVGWSLKQRLGPANALCVFCWK